jgi:hypothetical protein
LLENLSPSDELSSTGDDLGVTETAGQFLTIQ